MTQYEYEARKRDGGVTIGRVEARNRRGAADALRKQDLFVVRLRPYGPVKPQSRAAPHATPTEVAWHMWQLAMMLDTGLTLSDALGCLARQARKPALQSLLEDIERRVREGHSMSAAMEAHRSTFPVSLTALVRASELSGSFKEVLRKASQYLMSDLKMMRRLRGAMVYPAAMLSICAAVTVFLLTVILPKFAGIFEARNATLPAATRVLMGMSEGVIHNWMIIICSLVAAAYLFLSWSRTAAGISTIDRILITAPIAGPLMNAFYQARIFSAMSLMLESHVPLLDTIGIAQNIAPNSLYRTLWREVEEQVRVGERLAQPMYKSEFISESVAQVIDNGDRNGKLGPVFSHLAEFFDEEYKRAMSATTQLIEPCLIVVMGGIIGFVAVALMLPLVQASRVVSGAH